MGTEPNGTLCWYLSVQFEQSYTILYKPCYIGLCIGLSIGQCKHTITNAAKKQFKSKLNSFKYKLVYQAVVSSLSEYVGFIYKQNLNSVQFGRSKILTSSVTNDANSLHIMDFSFLLLFVSRSAYQRVKARFRQGRCTRLRTNVLTLLQRSFQELYEIVNVAPVIRDTN